MGPNGVSKYDRAPGGTSIQLVAALRFAKAMQPNNALERSVTGLSERTAGAQIDCAPAARRPRIARPAQRGRWATRGATQLTHDY